MSFATMLRLFPFLRVEYFPHSNMLVSSTVQNNRKKLLAYVKIQNEAEAENALQILTIALGKK